MILDTSFIIDFLKNRKEAEEKIKELVSTHQPIRTTTISVFEIWQGISDMADKSKKEKIEAFLASIGLFGFDLDSAKLAGTIAGSLRAKGEPIEGTDCMIAAIVIKNNETLLTGNRKHFERISDLKIESY